MVPDFGVLKDAADAIDTMVDTVRKLAELIAEAAAKGVQLVEWAQAKVLARKLTNLQVETSRLYGTQAVTLNNALTSFIRYPNELTWPRVRESVSETLAITENICALIENDRSSLSTLPFFKPLLVAIAQREQALGLVLELKRAPATQDELAAIKHFAGRYLILVEELGRLDDALSDYIRKLGT